MKKIISVDKKIKLETEKLAGNHMQVFIDMITAEVAVYPLKTDNATKVINDSINVLDSSNVDYKVKSMNT